MRHLIRIVLFLLIILLLTCSGYAQCSGSGTSWNCVAGTTQAQVQTALNAASNGATLTFANGSYSWSGGHITFSNINGATLICATVGGCIVSSSGNAVIGWAQFATGTNNNLYRVSGFVFNDASGARLIWGPYSNPCGSIGSPCILGNIQFDHNVGNLAPGANFFSFADGASNFYVFGVANNNTLNASGNAMLFQIITGLVSPAMSSALGAATNFFVENNNINITTMTNPGESWIDSWGAARMVVRYNTYTNALAATHGVNQAGAGGPENLEFYNNHGILNSGSSGSGFEDGYRLFHDQGGSLSIFFNNIFTPYRMPYNGSIMEMLHYRDYPNAVDGGLPPDAAQCSGSVNGPSDAPFVIDGNRSPTGTYQGYPCWRQPGRDPATQNYMPMYAWNNTFSTGGQVLLNVPDGGFGSPDYQPQHLVNNRDYFNAVSASAQSNPTTPFNGTVGMGFGTLSNRPTTCTTSSESALGHGAAGVGYFATDVGSQGTLYTCSASNAWTVFFTPYTYPYPGSGGGGTPAATFTPSSASFGTVPVGSPPLCPTNCMNITLTNTGTATLSITLPFNTSSPSNYVIISNGCAAAGGSLNPGNSCITQVQFQPQTVGPINAALNMNTNAGPQSVPLSGIGGGTVLPAAPTIGIIN